MSFSESGVPTGGYPSHEASAAILELLEKDIELVENSVVSFQMTDRPAPQQTVFSQITKQVIELAKMHEGPEKRENRNKIIGKINEKLHLAQSIADRIHPESYSVGVGFPFGVQVSFSWLATRKG